MEEEKRSNSHEYGSEDKDEIQSLVEDKTQISIDNNPDRKFKPAEFKKTVKKNPWVMATIVLGIIVLILLVLMLRGGITGNIITGRAIGGQDAGDKLIDYLNSRTGGGVEYISHEDIGNLYEVLISYQGQELPVYITKDGSYFVQGAVPLDEPVFNNDPNQQPSAEIPKSDKPEVELFIMSFCPFGTQAEKGILPVVGLLDDKIDFKLRTVHYILHGEKEDIENKRELCIREEQGQDKLNKYLVCILDSENPQEPADVTVCEKDSGIDSAKLQTCMDINADSYFESDSQLSEVYGVRGSPTLIINGARVVDPSSYSRDPNSCTKSDSEEGKCVIASIGRSPSSYLEGICSAFNTAPEECSEKLSSATPSAGFGYNEGTDTVAQC